MLTPCHSNYSGKAIEEPVLKLGDKTHLHQKVIQPETLICKRSSDQLMGERQVEKEALTEAGFTEPSMTFQTKNSSDPSTKGLFSKTKD